jgi:hypothetical protein
VQVCTAGSALQGLSGLSAGPVGLAAARRPCGRRTWPSWGFAASRVSREKGSAYSLRRSRPSVSTARRSSRPLRTSCRLATAFAGPLPAHTTLLSQARAPLQGFEPRAYRRRAARRFQLSPGCTRERRPTTLLGFLALQRFRHRGSAYRGCCLTRHGPASAFLTLSPVYSPRDLSGLVSSR